MKYTYQIKSVIYNPERGITCFRLVLATENYFHDIDVPAEIFDHETLVYMRFRLKVCEYVDLRNLPRTVQDKIRTPLGRFLDHWILEEYDGRNRERKNPDA